MVERCHLTLIFFNATLTLKNNLCNKGGRLLPDGEDTSKDGTILRLPTYAANVTGAQFFHWTP